MHLRSLLFTLGFTLSSLLAAEPPEPEPGAPVKISQPSEDGSVLLRAKDVTIHGKMVRYETQPHKDTIGYWTKVDDWVSWDFKIKQPGKFTAVILQGCGSGSGGSEVEFTVGEQTHLVTVKDTGSFQKFIEREIGEFTFDKPGVYTLSVKPKTKPGLAVMDLRQVLLKPVKSRDITEKK